MLFSIIRDYLKSKTKSLGFYEHYDDLLSREECYVIEAQIFEELNRSNDEFWTNVFKITKHHFLLDKYVLQELRKSSSIWQLRSFQIKIFRIIWLLVDLIRIITFTNKSFHCSVRSTGDMSSGRVVFIYSKHVARGDVLNSRQDFFQHDFLISRKIPSGNKHLCSSTVDSKVKWECLKVKLKHPYCNGEIIFETLMARILLKKGISSVANRSNKNAAFSREGCTPISRIFLAVAAEEKINSVVFYTRPIVYEYMYVPQEIDTLLLVSEKSSPKFTWDVDMQVLHDNPFLSWRGIASSPSENNTIGLLLGDEYNRWEDQKYHDEKILGALSGLEGIICLGRPHPQEMTRPNRVRYYKNLVRKYPFLRLEVGNLESFLTDISVLITYSKSSMVQESLMCKRPVIECAEISGFSPNADVINKAAGLAFSCSGPEDLATLVKENMGLTEKESLFSWHNWLSNLGIELEEKQASRNGLMNCFY